MRPPYLTYRPLRAGVAILSGVVDQYGTLGCFARAADGTVWLISCYHVLGRIDFTAFQPGEEIFQPDSGTAAAHVATTSVDRADSQLDCAAALVASGMEVANEILGLGRIDPLPAAPLLGQHVCKYGVATELTEGVVTAIDGDDITIHPPNGFPSGYKLSAIGDSGALWLEQGSLRPVALHKQGAVGTEEKAIGTAITAVLSSLRLTLF